MAPTNSSARVVFCATDFSETAALALEQARGLISDGRGRLVLGHVVEPLPVDPYPMPTTVDTGEAALRELARTRLEAVASALRDEGVEVDTHLTSGVPGPQLVDAAEAAGATLLVIGTRGLTGLKHLLLGSTAEHVVRRASCPVLTIHPDDRGAVDRPSRVVLPTDLSDDAAVAFDALVATLDEDARPRVDLVFADETPPYLDMLSHENLARQGRPDQRREEIEAALAPLARRIEGAGFPVSLDVLDGSPVAAVAEHARERGADLIVMSTHGRSALMNVLLGRTAQRIVQHAPCPVLSVCPRRWKRAASD